MAVTYFEQATCERCGREEIAPADHNVYALRSWAFIRAVAYDAKNGSTPRTPPTIQDQKVTADYEEGHALLCPQCADEFWEWWNAAKKDAAA